MIKTKNKRKEPRSAHCSSVDEEVKKAHTRHKLTQVIINNSHQIQTFPESLSSVTLSRELRESCWQKNNNTKVTKKIDKKSETEINE